jgi:hypothetical protein
VGFDGCEVRLCGLCAFVRPRVPCVSCASRPPGVFLPVNILRNETRERAFAMLAFFVDVDVGVLSPVLLL